MFSRKPIFGYTTLVYATISIAALSVAVWAHHMYVTGAVLLPFFSFMTFDRGAHRDQVLQLDRHDVEGQVDVRDTMLFSMGFLVTFLLGGLSGVLLASPPLDFHVSDSYFVVATSTTCCSRHHRVRHLRGHLFLVPEDDRPGCSTSGWASCTSG